MNEFIGNPREHPTVDIEESYEREPFEVHGVNDSNFTASIKSNKTAILMATENETLVDTQQYKSQKISKD